MQGRAKARGRTVNMPNDPPTALQISPNTARHQLALISPCFDKQSARPSWLRSRSHPQRSPDCGPAKWNEWLCKYLNINIIININLYIYFAQTFTGTFNDPTLIRVVIRWLHAGEQPAQQLSRQIENVQMSVCAPTRETLASRCVCSRGAFNQPPCGGVKLFSLSEREEHLSRSLRARLARPASQFVRPHCLSKGQFARYQTVIVTFMYDDHLQGAWAEVSHPGCSDGAKKTKCPVQSSRIYYYQP